MIVSLISTETIEKLLASLNESSSTKYRSVEKQNDLLTPLEEIQQQLAESSMARTNQT